ncbi:DUF3300 domain-containing protein [Azotobacter salinestris]|uniref:DUF3300 domain-containing protein n=1 Tax=Azotobacter salinestris TaxID=69964 RepID=UPI0032DE4A66
MRIDRRFSTVLLAWLALAGWPEQAARAADPPATTVQSEAVFRQEELDQMLAPLALYPDALLAQVLMASTYPGDVADAVVWSRAHPDVSGDDAVRQVANEPWDPSVQSLVAFPAVLVTLGQDPAWVQRVGDAFLAQPADVMDSVQRLRRQAQAAGNLQSSEQQRVIVQPAPPASTTTVVQAPAPTQTIVIEPADPQVVYVPSYNPSVVYGTWPNPSYPPAYYPPPPGYYFGSALVAGLGFAAGVAVIDSIWGDCDWDHGDIDIDVEHYNNLNRTRQLNINQNKWQHNAVNRDGVPYRDRASRERYGQRLPGSEQRAALRGREPVRAAERERARQTLSQRGIEAPASSNREARERAQAAGREMRDQPQARQRTQASAQPRRRTQSSPQVRQQARQKYSSSPRTRDNAFAGARNPSRSQVVASRGEASRASASRPKLERSGRQVQRAVPAASRGGGRRR